MRTMKNVQKVRISVKEWEAFKVPSLFSEAE